MGKSRKRVLFCFSPRLRLPRQTWGGPQFIASERITPRAAWSATISEPATLRDVTRISSKIRLSSKIITR